MKKTKYPSGKCESCGKIFERPHKFRTETEAYHVHGCRLDIIEKAIKNKEKIGNNFKLLMEVDSILNISSFGARKGNKYFKRMIRCKEIQKELYKFD